MTPRTLPLLALLASAPAWAYGGPPSGQVLVVNESGTTVYVDVTGCGDGRSLRAGERAVLDVKPGEATVRASYRLFGENQPLESERTVVRPHRTSVVVLEPDDHAHVLVTNATRYDADLVVDGQRVATLVAGEAEVVSVDIGYASLELLARNGRSLGEKTVKTRAYAEHKWTVELPTFADVTVTNPLPIEITLVDDRGQARRVPARGKTVYEDVPFGTLHLTATRPGGDFVDEEWIKVDERCANAWTVDPPPRGFVLVDSDAHFDTRVLVDGRPMATLRPYGDARLELTVGWHEIEVTDDRGRVLEETWVEVDPYSVREIELDRDPRRPGDGMAQVDREHHDHERPGETWRH